MSDPNRLYPLCALAMSAHLVDRLANTGLVPYDEFELLIRSTLNLTPGTPLDVYGGTVDGLKPCLLYTSPSPRDRQKSRMPSSA